MQPSEAGAELADDGAVLVDFASSTSSRNVTSRAPSRAAGHLIADRAVRSDRSQRVILYCATGTRSALAAKTLADDLGYEDVSSMAGGITLWRDRGLPVVTPRSLTQEQKERYSRHVLVPEIGLDGQLKLLDAKVLLLGTGGLGSPSALYLAAAGVGTLGLIDDDVVDASNLQRQVIHNTERIGMPKTESARLTIEALNPDVEVVEHNLRFGADNVIELLSGYDVVVDGADNFPTRYLLKDASVGSASRSSQPRSSPSTADLDLVPFEGPATGAVPDAPAAELAPTAGPRRLASCRGYGPAAALEVVKLVTGAGTPLIGAVLFEALGTEFTAQGQARPRLPDLRPERAPGRRRGSRQVSRLRPLLRVLTGREARGSASSPGSRANRPRRRTLPRPRTSRPRQDCGRFADPWRLESPTR